MHCDWIFRDQHGKVVADATLAESTLPHTGDGKVHSEKNYKVTDVLTRPTSGQNPVIIAKELDS